MAKHARFSPAPPPPKRHSPSPPRNTEGSYRASLARQLSWMRRETEQCTGAWASESKELEGLVAKMEARVDYFLTTEAQIKEQKSKEGERQGLVKIASKVDMVDCAIG